MKGYHAPSFQDRAAASLEAKHKELAAMKAVPRPDASVLVERAARYARRDALAQAKAAKARETRDEQKRLADEKRAATKENRIRAARPKKSEAEMKAARDARYAARKNRK